MYGSVGRSGHHTNQQSCPEGEWTSLGNWDDWTGLSENGRQYRNELTGEIRDISGADYWHKRKELWPKNEATTITAESFKTPSYYHVRTSTQTDETSVKQGCKQEFSTEQCNATGDVAEALLEDDTDTSEAATDVSKASLDERAGLAVRVIGGLVLIIIVSVIWQWVF